MAEAAPSSTVEGEAVRAGVGTVTGAAADAVPVHWAKCGVTWNDHVPDARSPNAHATTSPSSCTSPGHAASTGGAAGWVPVTTYDEAPCPSPNRLGTQRSSTLRPNTDAAGWMPTGTCSAIASTEPDPAKSLR
jgi:hypothetical protein